MRVMSLLQPWATLVVIGAKRFETRSWPCPKGPWRLAIHASQSPRELLRLQWGPIRRALEKHGYASLDQLPLGAVIGTANVMWSGPVENMHPQDLTDYERAFGDYTPGRFAWCLKLPVQVPPIPMKGAQGLRELPPEILARLPEAAL